MTKNLLTYLKNDDDVQAAAISRGKMTPRKKSMYSGNIKKYCAKLRRAALKRGDVSSMASQFGGEGHSNRWD